MNDLKAKSDDFRINGQSPRVLSLKRVDASSQGTAIRYCGDAYRVLTGDGKSRTGWEFNLNLDVRSQGVPMTIRKAWFVLAAMAAILGAVPVLRLTRGAQPVGPDLVLHEAGFSRTCPLPATSKCPPHRYAGKSTLHIGVDPGA